MNKSPPTYKSPPVVVIPPAAARVTATPVGSPLNETAPPTLTSFIIPRPPVIVNAPVLLVVDCVTLFKNIFAFTCTVPPAEFKFKLPNLVSIVLVLSCILPKVETPVASN